MELYDVLMGERKARRDLFAKEQATYEKERKTAFEKTKKLKADRADYLATPGQVEEDVAKLAEYFSPTKSKVKLGKYTRAETLRRREEGGPLEDFQKDVGAVYQGMLRSKEYLDMSPERVLAQAGQHVMTENGYLEALSRNKLKADTSLGRLFGALGPDKSVKKPPGYDEWKADEEVRQDLATKSEWFHPAESAAYGAGGYVAFEMAKRVFKKRALSAAVTALIPLPGARPIALAKVAMAAAMAIPEFFAFDVGQNVVRHSKWAKARQVEGKIDRADIAELGLGTLVAGGAGIPARAAWKKLEGKFGKAVKEKIRHEAEHGIPSPGSGAPLKRGAWGTFREDVAFPGDSAVKVLSAEKAMSAADKFADSLRKEFKVSDYNVLESVLGERRIGIGKVPVSQRYVPEIPKVVKPKTIEELIGDNLWVYKDPGENWARREFSKMSVDEVDAALALSHKKGVPLRKVIFNLRMTKEFADAVANSRYNTRAGKKSLVEEWYPEAFKGKAKTNKIVTSRIANEVKKVKATKEVKKVSKAVSKKMEEAGAGVEREASTTLKTPLMDMVRKAGAEEVTSTNVIKKNISTMIESKLHPGGSGAEVLETKAGIAIQKVLGNSDVALAAKDDLLKSIVESTEAVRAGGTSIPSATGIYRDWFREWGGKLSLSIVGTAVIAALPAGYAEASDMENKTWRVQQLLEETELSSANTEALTSQGESIVKSDGTLSDSFKNFGESVLEVGTVALDKIIEVAKYFDTASPVSAAMIPKGVVPLIQEAIPKGKKAVRKIMEDLYDAGHVHVPLPEGAKSVEHIPEALHTAPDIMEQVSSMKEALTGKKTPFMGWLMSPFGQAQTLYKSYSERVGGKLKTFFMSPAPDLASGQNVRVWRIKDHLEALGNILHDVVLPKRRTKVILDEMSPLATKYKETEIAYSALKMAEEHLNGKLERTMKALTKGKKGRALGNLRKTFDEITGNIEKINKGIVDLAPKHEQFLKDWQTTVMKVARKEPSTRIALMVEDAHIHEGLKELPGLLTEAEKQAVVHIKDMMQRYAGRFARVGEETISNRAYIHHAWHPEWTKAAAEKRLLSYGLGSDVVPYSKMFHRSKFSRQMSPDIDYVMQKYIFDSERRIQALEFWDKKKLFSKESWWTHYQWVKSYGSKELKGFWENINRGFTPPPETNWNTLANRYSAIEVLRLIAFAPSTAFKHYFKNIGTASAIGLGEFLHTVPTAFKQGGRILAHDIATAVAPKLGLKAPKQLTKLEDQLAKSFIGTSKGVNVFAGIDLEPAIRNTVGFWPAFDKQLAKVNKAGGSLIGLVETVDRTHTFRAAMDIAAKEGLTVKQSLYSYWSNILEMNFLSGELNPAWVRNPLTRAIFLFQNTAYKIFERRGLTALNAGKDIISAGKVIKGNTLEQTMKDLYGVGKWMVGLEKDLKKNLILENLTSSKDIFGIPYIQRAMRETVMSGIVLGGGSAIGLNLFPQVIHVPFLAHGASEPTLSANPLVHALFRTTMGHEQGGRAIEDEDFWFSEFVQEWLRGSGYINQTANKIRRMVKGEVPTLYEKDTGSIFPKELLYLFSVPRKKEVL